jgi:hypothetical protein
VYLYLLYAVHAPKIPAISACEENIPLIFAALVSAPSSTHTDRAISHFVIWNSLSPLSYYNGSHKPTITKEAATGTTRDILCTQFLRHLK